MGHNNKSRRLSSLFLGSALSVPLLIVGTNSYAADDSLTQINLGAPLLSDVRAALPETSAVNESFLSGDYNPNIRLSEDSHLAVTFVDEGAGYRNAVGYFQFSDNAFDGLTFSNVDSDGSGRVSLSELNALNGVEADVMFSNFSESGGGGSLNYGDTLVIGGGSLTETDNGLLMSGGKLFEAGSNVGFFLSANAYTSSGVAGFDKAGDPNTFYSLDFLNPEAGAFATIDNADENARHTAMMFADTSKDAILVGFEDLIRPYGDNDFNDAIFLVQSDPASALQDNVLDIATAPSPTMGGMVTGILGVVMGGGWLRRRRINESA